VGQHKATHLVFKRNTRIYIYLMAPTNQVYPFATTFKASILSILLELCAFTLGPFVVNRKELKFSSILMLTTLGGSSLVFTMGCLGVGSPLPLMTPTKLPRASCHYWHPRDSFFLIYHKAFNFLHKQAFFLHVL